MKFGRTGCLNDKGCTDGEVVSKALLDVAVKEEIVILVDVEQLLVQLSPDEVDDSLVVDSLHFADVEFRIAPDEAVAVFEGLDDELFALFGIGTESIQLEEGIDLLQQLFASLWVAVSPHNAQLKLALAGSLALLVDHPAVLHISFGFVLVYHVVIADE